MKIKRNIGLIFAVSALMLILVGCGSNLPINGDVSAVVEVDNGTLHAQDAESPSSVVGASNRIKLDVNDVTWLFPPPDSLEDVEQLISPAELLTANGPALPHDLISNIVDLIEANAFEVGGFRIRLLDGMNDPAAWKIVGFRVDPSAPSLNPRVQAVFGQIPQIRLILQPVSINGDSFRVHDVTLHIIYSFTKGENPRVIANIPNAIPDTEKFQKITNSILELKAISKLNGVDTNGKSLGVHPGLLSDKARLPLLEGLEAFFIEHLDPTKLTSLAIMGIDEPEPWIFAAMRRNPENGKLSVEISPAVGKKTQMLNFRGQGQMIEPLGAPSNRNPAARTGVTTAVLFSDNNPSEPVPSSQDPQGNQLTQEQVPDWIAHPQTSHFFNTDCVSCHTESSRRVQLDIRPSQFTFTLPSGVSGLDPSVLPTKNQNGTWNVRNLGWFPEFFPPKELRPTITQRTFTETVEVVENMNRNFVK